MIQHLLADLIYNKCLESSNFCKCCRSMKQKKEKSIFHICSLLLPVSQFYYASASRLSAHLGTEISSLEKFAICKVDKNC